MALPYKRGGAGNPKDKDAKKRLVVVVKRAKMRPVASHGGAWKVAYADFVTAMMAFFLLLWLISTSSKATLQGLAEYFTPTSGIGEMRPVGLEKLAPSPTNQPEAGINLSSPGVMQQQAGATRNNPNSASPTDSDGDDNLFERGANAIQQTLEGDPQLGAYKDNVTVLQTPEGLRVDLQDTDKYPMFMVGSSALSEHAQRVLARLVPVLRRLPNYMSVTGYTDASTRETEGMTRWQLSSARAQEALDYMQRVGLEAERAQSVIGAGDAPALSPGEPRNARNRRVSLLMLRGSHILIPDSALPGRR